ncbi:hypothetical protein LEMLEM_LOCUS6349, partial [Lemmus lemmus]
RGRGVKETGTQDSDTQSFRLLTLLLPSFLLPQLPAPSRPHPRRHVFQYKGLQRGKLRLKIPGAERRKERRVPDNITSPLTRLKASAP